MYNVDNVVHKEGGGGKVSQQISFNTIIINTYTACQGLVEGTACTCKQKLIFSSRSINRFQMCPKQRPFASINTTPKSVTYISSNYNWCIIQVILAICIWLVNRSVVRRGGGNTFGSLGLNIGAYMSWLK